MARGSTWSLARAGVLLPVLLHPHLSAALHPIEVQSQDFVETGTGNRFEIIGVDYQPGGSAGFDPKSGKDPLSDEDICIRDAALMQKLGLNTIRTYNVDPYINHDACASIFNAVGIYILVDGEYCVFRSSPKIPMLMTFLQSTRHCRAAASTDPIPAHLTPWIISTAPSPSLKRSGIIPIWLASSARMRSSTMSRLRRPTLRIFGYAFDASFLSEVANEFWFCATD